MKKTLLLLTLFYPFLLFSTAYHTITIDGSNDFAPDEDFSTSSFGYTAYCTWDASNLYLGYTGSDVGSGESGAKWIVWYIDTDPQLSPKSGNGTDNAAGFNTQDWTLPFYADYFLQIRTDEGFNQLNSWNGSSWQATSLSASIFDNDGSNFIELRLPLSDLGNPSKIYILGYFIHEQSGNEWTYASWPDNSLDFGDGYKSAGNFSHWYGYTLQNGVSPDDPDNYDQSLPVSLSSFTAEAGDARVTLRWVTESEVQNEAFILERGLDEANFVQIAEIPGQGSSNHRQEYSFTDAAVQNGVTYYYRLADRDYSGAITYHNTVTATPNSAGSHLNRIDLAAGGFRLHPNFPNPFNPETHIRFEVPVNSSRPEIIRLEVYNAAGQRMRTLYSGQLAGGAYEMAWDGRNGQGEALPSGTYFLHLRSNRATRSQKMILLR